MKLKLDEKTALYYENEIIKGVRIVVNYSKLWENKKLDLLGNMLLAFINIKSDSSGYNKNNIIDIETYYNTNKMEIVFGMNEKDARSLLSHYNYYLDDKKTLSFIIESVESCNIYQLYGENKDYEEFKTIIEL